MVSTEDAYTLSAALVERMLALHQAAAIHAGEKEMLKCEIAATDRQINALMYGLTEGEIKIVEG
jgi:hypothetical protein